MIDLLTYLLHFSQSVCQQKNMDVVLPTT